MTLKAICRKLNSNSINKHCKPYILRFNLKHGKQRFLKKENTPMSTSIKNYPVLIGDIIATAI